MQGGATGPTADRTRRREIVAALLATSRNGEFDALAALLDPEAVLRADATVVQFGAPAEVRDAREVAASFSGRAKAAHLANVDGAAGAVWSQGGTPKVVFAFTIEDDRIVAIDMLAEHLDDHELELID